MTYELKHIAYDVRSIAAIAGVFGLTAVLVGACIVAGLYYSFGGYVGAEPGYIFMWAGGIIGGIGLGAFVAGFVSLSLFVAIYNHFVVPAVGGLRVDII